jgi:hypothetical protein
MGSLRMVRDMAKEFGVLGKKIMTLTKESTPKITKMVMESTNGPMEQCTKALLKMI